MKLPRTFHGFNNNDLGAALFVSVILSTPASVGAQSEAVGGFQITKSVIASGGGSSSGSNFQLDGTIAQPMTDQSSGGNFVLQSGFWPGGSSGTQEEVIFKDGFES